MFTKNTELVADVVAYGSEGEGVIRTENGTVFVPFCLVGERVRVKILKAKGTIAYGKLLEVIVSSPDRTLPRCPVFAQCGGCALQHLSYQAQLAWKREQVRSALKKLGNVDAEVLPAVPCDFPFGYRNKLQLPVGVREGKTVVGFYAERSHRIVPLEDCPITPWAKEVISLVQRYVSSCGVDGYDEGTGKGILRHVVVREIAGKFIVTMVTATKKLPKADVLISFLKETFSEFTLWHNVNAERSNVIFGKEFFLLYGNGTFSDTESGIVYGAGANTFVQVNRNIRQKLYGATLAKVKAEAVVVDCYAGGGLLTAMLAKKCRRAYGIEIIPEAVACADALKRENGLSNLENICGKVEDVLPALMQSLKGEDVVLTVDPPRKGLERSVVEAIVASGVKEIVMISCNPATLARDLGLLTGALQDKNGQLVKGDGDGAYEIRSIEPYDMFPQTKHVETLICLKRKQP